MGFKRITDLRVRYQQPEGLDVYVRSGGDPGVLTSVSPARAGAMLQVFNAGRRCFWDFENFVFTTDVTLGNPPKEEGQLREGKVSSWEIIVPREGDIFIALNLVADAPTGSPRARDETSGEPVLGRAIVKISNDDEVAGVTPLLGSRYLRFEANALRNTDYQDWPK